MNMEHLLNDKSKGKKEYLKKNLSQYHFYHKSHMGLNTGFRPTTIFLSHGTVSCVCVCIRDLFLRMETCKLRMETSCK